jgi:hypothetical protein
LVEDSNHPSGDAGALDEYAKGMVKGKFFGFKIAGSGKDMGRGSARPHIYIYIYTERERYIYRERESVYIYIYICFP